jgi:hypothetical protein
MPALFFVDAANKNIDVAVVRENTEPKVTIDGHYSQAIVPCGTNCTAFWIVDGNTGAIIGIPESPAQNDVVYDVQGRRDSNVVKVTYGAGDGSTDACRAQSFRLIGTKLKAMGEPFSAPCP